MSFYQASHPGDLASAHPLFKSDRDELIRRLGRSRELIMSCYDESLDLDRIAAESHFSSFHFHKLFLSNYGKTPHQMLSERRMGRAAHLLEHSSMSVTEVCFEVGFSSLGSFSSLFRRHFGMSPRAYRRRIFQPGWDPRSQFPSCLFAFWCGGRL